MEGQNPMSNNIQQSNCDAKLPDGQTICETKKMACQQISDDGEIECSSYCAGKLFK